MTYLFEATIGPIQSFIASGRRTRDLWFGSTLLSELSKTIAHTIVDTTKSLESLIFPAPASYTDTVTQRENNPLEDLKPNSALNVANKILARIDDSIISPTELGAKIEEELNAKIDTICNQLFEQLKNRTFDRNEAKAQIADLIEYSWVALEENANVQLRDLEYGKQRKTLEWLLAARKNTRNYKSITWHSNKVKSSIDGQLESVIPWTAYPHPKDSAQVQAQKAQRLFEQFRAGRSEQLSGVDLMKRLGDFSTESGNKIESTFFSTSHIASLPYLQRLNTIYKNSNVQAKKELEKAWNQYNNSVHMIHRPDDQTNNQQSRTEAVRERIPYGKTRHDLLGYSDGALLYGERLAEDAANQNRLNTALTSLQNFFDTVHTITQPEKLYPIPYYAIIDADGDGMGKVIDHLAKNKDGIQQHQKISQALDRFSRTVKGIIEGPEPGNQGTLVYAGGDDVLAFVPLHRALECAHELSVTFKDLLAPFKDEKGNQPTLSVGIVIVHHLSLLNEALGQARAAEKAAKQVPEKNALAIRLYKRGGETYTISGHWGNIDNHLRKLIDHYRADSIPKVLPYELRESLLRLTALQEKDFSPDQDTNVGSTSDLIAAIKADAKRIIQRKLQVPKRKIHAETKTLLQLLNTRIGITLDQQDLQEENKIADEQTEENNTLLLDQLQDQANPKLSTFIAAMETYIHELVIARELADALNLAEGDPILQKAEVEA